MFHFAFAELVQAAVPARERRKIVGHPFRKEDVAGVAAIHHPLCGIHPGAGDIRTIADVDHLVHRPAVDAHAQPDIG